jgi:hypothetical protein
MRALQPGSPPLMQPHPPKPRLTLRVGITGHRPNKLDDQAVKRIRQQLHDVFAAIDKAAADILRDNAAVYAEQAPVIRLICGFAEGADQMAVAVCPDGWRIEAILPFPKDEYLKDFEKSVGGGRNVRSEFEASLAKAAVVTELPLQQSGQRNQGYVDAGGYLLRQIELLIAVWDGLPPKPGGTGALVKEAVEGSIPVVWLSTAEERAPRLIKDFKDGGPVGSGADCTRDVLTAELMPIFAAPPPVRQGRHQTARAALDGFYREHWRPVCRVPFYDLLKRWTDGKKLRFAIHAEPLEKRVAEWDRFISDAPAVAALREQIRDVLVPRYVWADTLAVHFSHLYRSAYVLAYALSALAVFVALCGLFTDTVDIKAALVFTELAIISGILLIVRLGGKKLWHERWLEYRVIAESLRHGRFLAFVSEFGSIYDSTPNPGDREPPWMLWYIRATMREIGLPAATLDAAYQSKILKATVTHEIEEQIKYHHDTSESVGKIDHFLCTSGELCFFITFGMLILFLVVYGTEVVSEHIMAKHQVAAWIEHTLHGAKPWMILAAAGLPALGAAFFGIRVQGDFDGSKDRSTRMTEALTSLKAGYQTAMRNGAKLGITADLLIAAARVMSEDLAAWQELYGRKRLALPA